MSELLATYRLRVPRSAARARAEALALEQTVELPRESVHDRYVEEEILPRVEIVESGPHETDVCIRYPERVCGDDPAQLLGVLFGNASLLADVSLEAVELPAGLRARLGGPRHGISGWRKRSGVSDRPLTCTALKPMGLDAEAIGQLCASFARAGIDVIKDDNGLGDQAFCRFEPRVEACLRAVEAAARETGRRSLYAPNLIGTPARVAEQLAFARARGVEAVMLQPAVLGLPAFAEIVASEPGVLLLAHPALAGAPRISPAALLGQLFRAFGADAVIFPHAGGRFPLSPDLCRRLAACLSGELRDLRPALPVPAGGMTFERVSEIVGFYGRDCMLLVGGALYAAGAGLATRARAFCDAVARAAEAAGARGE